MVYGDLPDCESKKGVSALQLHRTLGIARKTAWYLRHRIRTPLGNESIEGLTLLGDVEVDETLIGGKRCGKGRSYRGNKVRAAGTIQRDGDVRLDRIFTTCRATLYDLIARTVKDEVGGISTDELASYLGIADADTRHATVYYSEFKWTFGDMQTNSIERIWALFKQSIFGAFHHVAARHLERLLVDLEWQFSNRRTTTCSWTRCGGSCGRSL